MERERPEQLQDHGHSRLTPEDVDARRQEILLELARKSSKTYEMAVATYELAKRLFTPETKIIPVTEKNESKEYAVTRKGMGPLTTEFGRFWEYEFSVSDQWDTYSVLVKADIDMDTLVPVFKDPQSLILRTDSGCKTGQVFGDLTCDCGPQLKQAMKIISESEQSEGMIINIPNQDGRGMGLNFKLATLFLQEAGQLDANTVQAAELLSTEGEIDRRTYAGIIAILKFFNIPETTKVYLATNNPDKEGVFRENGYALVAVANKIKPNEHTRKHFKAKEDGLGHRDLTTPEGPEEE